MVVKIRGHMEHVCQDDPSLKIVSPRRVKRSEN